MTKGRCASCRIEYDGDDLRKWRLRDRGFDITVCVYCFEAKLAAETYGEQLGIW